MRKTINNVVCTGKLIRKEFIEETKDGKLSRKVRFTVRYAPNMELIFYAKYNKVNAEGKESVMYDWCKEVFDKYQAVVSLTMTGRDSTGKPQWKEVSGEADKVTCKAELNVMDNVYRSKKSNEIEIALNKFYKMNGKYGIAHADEDAVEEAKITLEVFLRDVKKQTIDNEEIVIINAYGMKEGFGNITPSIYPVTIKVPSNGVEDTMDKLDSHTIKDGITVVLRCKILNGKEMIKVGEDFDGEDMLTSKNLDELRLYAKINEDQIYDASEENKKAIDPDEIRKLVKERNERIEKLKQEFESKENFSDNISSDEINEEDLPF